MTRLESLTDREREVVILTCTGIPQKEVAWRLGLSPKTVNAHLFNIYKKLGITNRVMLIHFAIANNLVELLVAGDNDVVGLS